VLRKKLADHPGGLIRFGLSHPQSGGSNGSTNSLKILPSLFDIVEDFDGLAVPFVLAILAFVEFPDKIHNLADFGKIGFVD